MREYGGSVKKQQKRCTGVQRYTDGSWSTCHANFVKFEGSDRWQTFVGGRRWEPVTDEMMAEHMLVDVDDPAHDHGIRDWAKEQV